MANAKDEYLHLGFSSWHGHPARFERFHRHNEVELSFIERGSMTYILGSGQITFQAGQLTVFWGVIPHQLIQLPAHTIWHWLTIPLAWFLQWQLPDAFTQQILSGKLVIDRDTSHAVSDLTLFNQWHDDLRKNSPEHRKIVLLEAEVRLRRLAVSTVTRDVSTKKENRSTVPSSQAGLGKVEKMACFIAENYTELLRVAQIARTAGLHPDYAVTLFRKTCGMGLIDYLTQHRVSHAQRLLATTDKKVLDIALKSGFSSSSRFYTAFTRACGQSPKEYRVRMRTR